MRSIIFLALLGVFSFDLIAAEVGESETEGCAAVMDQSSDIWRELAGSEARSREAQEV